MAFGQQAGPPAPANQLRELLALLQDAGHTDFRDARGPMGFTQRQAAGRFTREEVAEFIDRLQTVDPDAGPPASSGPSGPPPAPAASPPVTSGPSAATTSVVERAMRGMPTEQLATELRRRGWLVLEP